jgi:hypothetical protein
VQPFIGHNREPRSLFKARLWAMDEAHPRLCYCGCSSCGHWPLHAEAQRLKHKPMRPHTVLTRQLPLRIYEQAIEAPQADENTHEQPTSAEISCGMYMLLGCNQSGCCSCS